MKCVDCGLWTADCRLQPGVKCRLQTEDWIMLQFPSLRATAATINRLTRMLFRLTWVIFRLTSVIFRLTGMQTFTVIRMFMVRGAIWLCSGSRRCRWIQNHLVIRRHVWECDNESVAHGLPYLEILKGWKKGNIFTKQHKMAHKLQMSLLAAEFWILMSQYNYSLRAPWERYAKHRTKIETWNQRIVNITVIIVINWEFG